MEGKTGMFYEGKEVEMKVKRDIKRLQCEAISRRLKRKLI